MPHSAPAAVAKLAAPRPEGAVRRGRLHALLDERQRKPIVWVVGPPGAGKTTVVAAFLAETDRPTLWYRIDEGDADPATFFLYLREAVAAFAGQGAKPLPLLTPEYLSDIAGFARRWFREAFRRLPAGTALVFDNYQDAGEEIALHRALAMAFEEMPASSNAFVVSRRDPPPPFARAVVNGTIGTVGWEDLRLSAEETGAIAAARGLADPAAARSVQEQANGWMAGVVLMTERLSRAGDLSAAMGADTLETVFDYFAGLAFDSAEPRVRDVLVRTALLPSISATTVGAVTGDPDAIRHLDWLCRRNLFVDRAKSAQPVYRYHPLFHAFLRARSESMLSSAERSRIMTRAAEVLEDSGETEQALALFGDADAWDEAERLLLANAQRLIDQGRWRTLEEWIGRLPAGAKDANPWLYYWLGRSRLTVSPVESKPLLAQVYQSFVRGGDPVGQMLSAVSMIEALYLEYCDFSAMDAWHERVTTLLQRGVRPSTPEDELRTNAVVMMACSYRFIAYPGLQDCVRRVEALLTVAIDPNLRIAVAGMLHAHVLSSVDHGIDMLARSAGRALLALPQITVHRTAHYLAMEGYGHYLLGRFGEAIETLSNAEAITVEHGLDELGSLVCAWRALSELRANRVDEAAATLERCRSKRKPRIGPTPAILDMAGVGVDFACGRTAGLLERMRAVHAHYERTGQYVGYVPAGWFGTHVALALGDLEAGAFFLDRVKPLLLGPHAASMIGAHCLLEAWLHQLSGNTRARDAKLREAMLHAANPSARVRYRWYPRALAAMMPVAIEHDIEAATACELIREFDVRPPSPDAECWPWPVKILTLGRFDLLIDGNPAEFSRKAPRRLLELLKAIVAFGGEEIDERKLADALWPDDDGDNGVHALHVSLSRLRKLLGHADAIQVVDGKVSLDPARCWVDALAFDRIVAERDCVELTNVERACGLYRGTFLGSDAEHSWLLPMRERLRTRFVEKIETLGSACESTRAWDRAAAWYQRGIDADPLIEAFHQGLIRCHLRADRRAEALGAYRRLRQTLSVMLGITPSASSEALYRTLYEPEPEQQSVANS